MKFRRQERAEEGVNLTPLIDVVFLLLIFFMVSTTFTKESHLTVNLPEADGQPLTTEVEQLDVVVDAQGGYIVNGKRLINTSIDTLRAAIDAIASDNTDIPFVITGDANASYQSIVSVMDLAGKMGFVNLSMATKTPSEDTAK